jgi:hypothetical protein
MATKDIGIKKPKFFDLDEASKKEILDNIGTSDMSEKDRLAALEFMTFGDHFYKRLKSDSHLTIKQVRRLFELHEERLKKLLLAQ